MLLLWWWLLLLLLVLHWMLLLLLLLHWMLLLLLLLLPLLRLLWVFQVVGPSGKPGLCSCHMACGYCMTLNNIDGLIILKQPCDGTWQLWNDCPLTGCRLNMTWLSSWRMDTMRQQVSRHSAELLGCRPVGRCRSDCGHGQSVALQPICRALTGLGTMIRWWCKLSLLASAEW
jgi:hypothetical protein